MAKAPKLTQQEKIKKAADDTKEYLLKNNKITKYNRFGVPKPIFIVDPTKEYLNNFRAYPALINLDRSLDVPRTVMMSRALLYDGARPFAFDIVVCKGKSYRVNGSGGNFLMLYHYDDLPKGISVQENTYYTNSEATMHKIFGSFDCRETARSAAMQFKITMHGSDVYKDVIIPPGELKKIMQGVMFHACDYKEGKKLSKNDYDDMLEDLGEKIFVEFYTNLRYESPSKCPKFMMQKAVIAFSHTLYLLDEECAKYFLTHVRNGAGLPLDSPILRFREKLTTFIPSSAAKGMKKHGFSDYRDVVAWGIQAWNLWLTDVKTYNNKDLKDIKKNSKMPTPTDPSDEVRMMVKEEFKAQEESIKKTIKVKDAKGKGLTTS